MVILTICVLSLSLTSAFPALPLGEAVVEKFNENGRTKFIVEVQEMGKPQPEKQPAREFPWPYPPVFESILPAESKQRLNQLSVDSTLSAEERANQINAVFDDLPQQIIERLPLPAEYERLPADVYRRIFYIHVAPGFKWAERQQLIRDIIESLPEEQKQLMHTPRIGGPPPGFELILAPTVYKQLLVVHHNPRLSKEEKAELITRIMRQVPQEQINQLPLPSGMDQLPVELQKRARSLVYDYSVPQSIRAQRVKEFVQALPAGIRPMLR